MCLDRVYEVYGGASPRVRTRYKVFRIRSNPIHLWPVYSGWFKLLPQGVWLNEIDYRPRNVGYISSSEDGRYPVGWHVFLSKEDAKEFFSWASFGECPSFVLRRVQCKGLLAIGGEGGNVVEVYKYIKIERED